VHRSQGSVGLVRGGIILEMWIEVDSSRSYKEIQCQSVVKAGQQVTTPRHMILKISLSLSQIGRLNGLQMLGGGDSSRSL